MDRPEDSPTNESRAESARGLRTLLWNILFKAWSVPVEKICRLLIVTLAAPLLGPAGFGVYQFATTLALLAAVGTELGVGIWTTRALARADVLRSEVVATGLFVRAAASVVCLVVVGVLALFEREGEGRRTILLVGVATVASSFVDYAGAIFRGHEDMRDEAVTNSWRAILILLFGLATVHVRHLPSGLAAGVAVGSFLSAGIAALKLHSKYPGLAVSAKACNRSLVRAALKEALPLWLAGLLSMVYFKCDVIILRELAGETETGLYGAAFKLFEATMLIPSVLLAVTFPGLVRGSTKGQPPWWQGLLIGGVTGAGVVAALILFGWAEAISVLIFGQAFRAAGASLCILALGLPAVFVNFALTHMLIARHLERGYVKLVAAMVVLNVSSNLVLVPLFQSRGAAASTVLTEVALFAGCVLLLRHAAAGHRASAADRSPVRPG